MNAMCHLPAHRSSALLAKTAIILTLILSLLCVTQAPAMPQLAKAAGAKCKPGCCANMACCVRHGEQPAQHIPAPVVPRGDVQLAALELHTFTLLYTVPATERTFVILDEARAGHALPPRLAGCIRLI